MNASSANQPSRVLRKRIQAIVQIGISVVLLSVVLRQVQWGELTASLVRMNPLWLAVAWVLFLLGIVVRAMRWQVLLRSLLVRRRLGELILWYFMGGFFNVLLPTGFGGDAIRVLELAQEGEHVGPVVNSVLVDRYLGLMALLAMGLTAGTLRPDLAPAPILGLLALLLASGLAGAWLLTRPWWRHWAQGSGTGARLIRAGRIADAADGLTSYSPGAVARALAVSVLFNLLLIGWNVAIALGLGLRLPVALFFVFVPITSAALLLPAFGGLGVREFTYMTVLADAGVPQATALALSLIVYAITVIAGLIGGVLYLGQGLRRARRKA